MITEQTIRDVYIYLRKHDNSIPDETLDFMLHASIDALKGKWQPIEEAPKDWKDVILYRPEERLINGQVKNSELVCSGNYSLAMGAWVDCNDNVIKPTHFMPLPSPPKQ